MVAAPFAFVTAKGSVMCANTGPMFTSVSLGACAVSPRSVRTLVARGAGTVLPIRLCNRSTGVSEVGRVTRGRNLVIVRSTTRTRNTAYGNGGINGVKSVTYFDFCPAGGVAASRNKVVAAGSRRLTRGTGVFETRNTDMECRRSRVNCGFEVASVSTTVNLTRLSGVSKFGSTEVGGTTCLGRNLGSISNMVAPCYTCSSGRMCRRCAVEIRGKGESS